jgi:hypothetical protein
MGNGKFCAYFTVGQKIKIKSQKTSWDAYGLTSGAERAIGLKSIQNDSKGLYLSLNI